MSDLKKDLEEINKYLNHESNLGKFKNIEAPKYNLLLSEVNYTGKILAIAEYIYAQRKAQHDWAQLKLQCFIDGVEMSKKEVTSIDEKIAKFEEDLKQGVYNVD